MRKGQPPTMGRWFEPVSVVLFFPQLGDTRHLRYDPSNVCGMWNGSVWGHFGGPSLESLLRGGGRTGWRALPPGVREQNAPPESENRAFCSE